MAVYDLTTLTKKLGMNIVLYNYMFIICIQLKVSCQLDDEMQKKLLVKCWNKTVEDFSMCFFMMPAR